MILLFYRKPCMRLKGAAWLFCFAAFLLFAPAVARADDASYADSLVARAKEMRLHEARRWQTLMHYRMTAFHGYESLIDDPAFFLALNGKKDPSAELAATLRAFFETAAKDDSHAQCKFIGRYIWLKEALDIDGARLPAENCAGYNEMMRSLEPDSAVLVFPVAYLNSPASMFGHTFLRIDSRKESRLLSFAVNYTAETDETNGILFAFKGLTGFYKGYYSILPYYEKIKEYGYIENRDIWEYPLNLTRAEMTRLAAHIWELKDVYSYYFFIDENCSYNLLFLLEAARPDAGLLDRLPPWVIPVDTLRAIKAAGMTTGQSAYRASEAVKIERIAAQLSDDLKDRSARIVEDGAAPSAIRTDAAINEADKGRALDLAGAYLQYNYSKKRIDKADYNKRLLLILAERSKAASVPSYDVKTDDVMSSGPPEASHGALLLGAGPGVKRGEGYQSIFIRPAEHGLTDPDEGNLQGAAISFLDSELRYIPSRNRLALEDVRIVGITSLSPIDRFFRPVSWRVSTGFKREEHRADAFRTIYNIDGGPGATAAFLNDGLVYAFLLAEAKGGGGLHDGYSIGLGGAIGLLKPVAKAWKTAAEVKALSFVAGDVHNVYSAELTERYTVNANNAVKFRYKRERFDGLYSTDLSVSWNSYW